MPKLNLPPDLILRGSLITLRRKCGKPSCHCATGEPHETPALSTSVDGLTQIITLRPEDIPQVQQALRRYQKAKADLDRRVRRGLTVLRRQRKKASDRGKRR